VAGMAASGSAYRTRPCHC